jgi:hypothetical protein
MQAFDDFKLNQKESIYKKVLYYLNSMSKLFFKHVDVAINI